MSRNPRAGPSCLTRTQQLREARTAALVKDLEKKQKDLERHQADPFRRRCRMVRPEPKKVDFTKPGMTKAMMARVKQAEKFKQEYERKQEMLSTNRQPRRTPAPIGGDARMGRERTPCRETRSRPTSPMRGPPSRPTTPRPPSRPTTPRPPSRPTTPRPAVPRVTVSRPTTPAAGPSCGASPRRPAKTPRTPEPNLNVSRKTNELARMMNADIVQAEPIGDGPINNIVIPPGIVNDDRPTIVAIPQLGADDPRATSQVANRSIQVISNSLDEQDALETSAVQSRLAELQQARRDFVITVANVGANAVNIEEESPPADLFPPTPPKQLYRVPDLEDNYLQPEYGTEHPDILAAREFIQQREAARRMQEEFERIATEGPDECLLNLDVPIEQELYADKDISWEEDEAGMCQPRPSRVKAYVPPVPQREEPFEFEPFDPNALERFFDVKRYPSCRKPPPGREHLNPDLWSLDDPWYKPDPGPDMPDLIEFDLIDFD